MNRALKAFFFPGSPGLPTDFKHVASVIEQQMPGFTWSAEDRVFGKRQLASFKVKKTKFNQFKDANILVAYSYGCRVLIDVLNEALVSGELSVENAKNYTLFLIAPYLREEKRLLATIILHTPVLWYFFMKRKLNAIIRLFEKNVSVPFETNDHFMKDLSLYRPKHLKISTLEKRSDFPSVEHLSKFKVNILMLEDDTTATIERLNSLFAKTANIEPWCSLEWLRKCSHICLWTHPKEVGEWILKKVTSEMPKS